MCVEMSRGNITAHAPGGGEVQRDVKGVRMSGEPNVTRTSEELSGQDTDAGMTNEEASGQHRPIAPRRM